MRSSKTSTLLTDILFVDRGITPSNILLLSYMTLLTSNAPSIQKY